VLLLSFLLLTGLLACAAVRQGRPIDSSPGDPGAVQFRAVPPPPTSPPEVTLEGKPIPLLSIEWVVKGKVLAQHPSEGAVEYMPRVAIPGGRLHMSLNSPVMPSRVEVRYFRSLDENGVPMGDATVMQCSDAESRCSLSITGDRLYIDSVVPDGSKLVVMLAVYGLRVEDTLGVANAPFADRASWGSLLELASPGAAPSR